MRTLAIIAVGLALALGLAAPSALAQNDQGGPDWEDTPLTSSTTRLFTPSSGALLAITSDGLMRSDDAGATWYTVDTAQQQVVYVDPTNQDVLYATSNTEPLLVSRDGGATWTSLMSGPPFAGKQLNRIAVSPADTSLIYAGLTQGSISDEYWFYRSNDAGVTWTELFHDHFSLCGWDVPILQAHPSDPARMFFSGGCHAGRDVSETVKQSTDQGQTLSVIYTNQGTGLTALSGFPQALVGGQGQAPQRWYLAVNRDFRAGGSFLLLSDDDTGSWQPVLNYIGGGADDPDKNHFTVTMSAIACDPTNPDTVYVARGAAYFGFPPTRVSSGVSVSNDAGQTWNDLGNQQEGTLNDLVLGIDGRYLFLATDHGVVRLAPAVASNGTLPATSK